MLNCNKTGPSSLLILSNPPEYGAEANSKNDHLEAFKLYSKYSVHHLPILGKIPKNLELNRFDAIVVHFTLHLEDPKNRFLSMEAIKRIGNYQGLKVLFLQDEYQNIIGVREKLALGNFDLLFTLVPKSEIQKVYPSKELPNLRIISTLAGYVPENLIQVTSIPICDRPITVGYRGRRMPFWLGALAQEKVQIAVTFQEMAKSTDIQCNISCEEKDRLYGKSWINFLSSCKAVLGVESGASVFDFDNKIRKNIISYLKKNPLANFKDIQRLFLLNHEGKIRLNQISPSIFEAAATRTALVLFEGDYSGILTPWVHYIPLKKDFSNFQKVLTILKDHQKLQELVDRTYKDIACNTEYSYRSFIHNFDSIIQQEFIDRNKISHHFPYSKKEFNRMLLFSFFYQFARISSRLLQITILRTGLRRFFINIWKGFPFQFRELLRPLIRIFRI